MSIILSLVFVRYIYRKYFSKNYVPGEHKQMFLQMQHYSGRFVKFIPVILLFLRK